MQKANEKMILNGVYFVYDVKKSGYNAFLSNGVCLVNVGFCGYVEKSGKNVTFWKIFPTFGIIFTSFITLLHNEKAEKTEGTYPLFEGLQSLFAICQFWTLFP